MNLNIPTGCQPSRVLWPMDHLLRERAIALGNTIEPATLHTYNSALTSYLTFICAHNLPTSPTEDTLSFYVVYMSHHISPRSVTTYLSGIVQQLEPFYPLIREICNSKLVQCTLQGCLKSCAQPTRCKRVLTISDLTTVLTHFNTITTLHDNLLFLSMLLTGFFSLMRLGEMAFPDDKKVQDWRKISCRRTVILQDDNFSFQLPFHKADRFFTGNTILVTWSESIIDPVHHFKMYLSSRDSLMPFHSALWLRANRTVPTRSFFIRKLRSFFDKDIGGQSMRAGGATFLAEKGVPPSLIQACGRWSSDAFLIYIRKNPALLIDLITAHN
jgi:hypothetical protein